MRKLMWFSIGFVAGCFLCAYLLWSNWFLLAAAILLPSSLVLCFTKFKPLKVAAAVLFGLSISFVWFGGYDALYLKTPREYDEQTILTTITVADYSFETDYGIAFDGRIELEDKSYQVRAYLNDSLTLSPGDEVHGDFTLVSTMTTEEGKPTYHQGKGILLLAYGKGEHEICDTDRVPMRFWASGFRKGIKDALERVFPDDTKAFAIALLLGDSTLLTYEEDTAYKVSGIRHVIAVSGLHVSILFSLLHMLAFKKRVSTAIIGVPILIMFAAVAGFTPSVVRACVMQILIIIAELFRREYDPPTALSFSALIMLLINPLTVTSVSFQLSLGCMVGIFLFSSPISNYIRTILRDPVNKSLRSRITRSVAGGASVTLSAMTVTTPLSAWYFGTVSISSIFTNLFTLWAVSFIFYGIMLSAILGLIWLPLGRIIGWCISWLIRYVQIVAGGLSSIPVSAVYTCSVYIVIWLVFSYVLIAAFIMIKKRKPALFAVVLVSTLFLSLGASWIEPRMKDMQVTVFDVGQGQSILLQSDNSYYLVDCGGDHDESVADTVSQKLLSQGITRIDGLILTHYDRDHAGAVPYLLSRIEANALYLPDIADDGDVKEYLRRNYADRIEWVNDTKSITYDNYELTLIASDRVKEENESGLSILFKAFDCDILITGDRNRSGELALLKQMNLPELELLVVGHHGAKSSTSFELLSALKPKTAVISVGKRNAYGHPNEEVLYRLNMFGCTIYRTDEEGTIVFGR